jgi:asparagine synthase (glutamine-hydrolysing)
MCGIVGIINKNGRTVDFDTLQRMAETLNHRGPDEEGHLIDGPVGFYHKRLAIIDLTTGRQPMTSGAVSVVFNGEIYNYIELREELKAKGHAFSTTSDTEVILRMYLEYGDDCVKRLNGMFAFLLHDTAQRRIFAARDHFGIKPLYYFVGENSILFASEIKALLEHPAVKPEPNYDAINDYLTFQYVLGDATMFKNIHRLEPGRYQVIDLDSMAINTLKFWEPDFSVDLHHTEAYFIYQLQNLLVDTISLQLRSDVPVGAYLSGGMDSSLVTILASENYPGRIKTFTGAFHEGPQFNESKYAKEVAEHCGAEMFVVYPTESDFIYLLPHLIYHMDEPAAGPGLFPQFMVSRLASQEVKVVLGGQGGDEIFGGYTRFLVAYFEQAIRGAIFETHDEGEHIVSLASILPNLPYLKPYVPMLKRFFEKDAFEPADRRYFRLIDRSEGDMGLLSADFKNGYNTAAIFSKFQTLFNQPKTLSYYNKMMHYDLVASLPALMQVEDRVTMANSLESRVPLLDHRIVKLITSMPPRMKFKGGEMKYILKKAIKNILPANIYHRKDKMGFPVPLHLWAKNNAGAFFRDVLLSKTCRERGLFNTQEIEKLIENENAFGRRLWGLLCLELWFRTFIDKRKGMA